MANPSICLGPEPPYEGLFNHIVLPTRLPGQQEVSLDKIEHGLLSLLQQASRALNLNLDDELNAVGISIRNILDLCKTINSDGKLDKTTLSHSFRKIELGVPLIIHVSEQNVGLIIQRDKSVDSEVVIFEAFEASAVSEEVLAAINALQWDFPGETVAIPYAEFVDVSFQDAIATFLERASTESVKQFAAFTKKGGSVAFENRDTANPSLISQLLMTILEANGQRLVPKMLRKRVRDEVSWESGGPGKPWRRSPLWLVIRVGIARYLYSRFGCDAGKAYYKFIVTLAMSQFLQASVGRLAPDKLALLKAKVARRLSKLEGDREKSLPGVRPVYNRLFDSLGFLFRQSLNGADQYISAEWNDFKESDRRRIPRLDTRADANSQRLTLKYSKGYIEDVLTAHRHRENKSASARKKAVGPAAFDDGHGNTFGQFARQFYSISSLEASFEEMFRAQEEYFDTEGYCITLAGKIESYLEAVGDLYDNNPEQTSIMILNAMKVWVVLDKCATKVYPILLDYHPGVSVDIFNKLQLPSINDMFALNMIQGYIQERCDGSQSQHRTIFDDPAEGCFAHRFFDHSEYAEQFREHHSQILRQAQIKYLQKEQEWVRLSREFEELQRLINESWCTYETDMYGAVFHDDKHCIKCYRQRCARRMKIDVHEHPLPEDPILAKVVIFELCCSRAFSAYRNITWTLFGVLTRPKGPDGFIPKVLLADYSELKPFVNSQPPGITLASTRKSILSTHYRGVSFPVSLDKVCFENSLKFIYYDTRSEICPGRQNYGPSYDHHLCTYMPKGSPFSAFPPSAGLVGPSSYENIAAQTTCPAGLNVHEYMAYRSLFTAKARRWPSILVELGSSNLNFSTKAPSLLICHLSNQVGPTDKNDSLRLVHKIFKDEPFCTRLMELVDRRLEGIASNWREVDCMEMLLTLILRLCLITKPPILDLAVVLLERAREILIQWIRHLRDEIRSTQDPNVAENYAEYSFLVALLCRRTFKVYAEKVSGFKYLIPLPELCLFIEASIALQDNAARDLSTLPVLSRNALIRDIKMVHQIRLTVTESLKSKQEGLISVLNDIFPQTDQDVLKCFSKLKFLNAPCNSWVEVTVAGAMHSNEQKIHYHILEGHLLVDGRPLANISTAHRDPIVLDRLFGKQRFLTYPSSLRGMHYRLPYKMCGHQIHIGFRGGRMIVQALKDGALLEYLPREIFGNEKQFDLPSSLVLKCVHWIDLNSGIIEIRREPDIWKVKPKNWRLNYFERQAYRPGTVLIDPYSQLFHQIARIFDKFEYPSHLTIFQSLHKLRIELRRLELSFFVTRQGHLLCPALDAVIDRNQDPGTWYGLRSKLVIRNPRTRERSILVPLGMLKFMRSKFHLTVEVDNNGMYGRYTINDALGRLECPAEPLLLYQKAQFHAYTSFVLPDPLTGRTGTEEAVHCLRSGYSQPWTNLTEGPRNALLSIANLSPKRIYYPPGAKTTQNVIWDDNLTTVIQHDVFWPLINELWGMNNMLGLFAMQEENSELQSPSDSFLRDRGYVRRCIYQRPNAGFMEYPTPIDLPYKPRDRFNNSKARTNVAEISSLIRGWQPRVDNQVNLIKILESWSNIGGFNGTFDKVLLTDILEVEFNSSWGSLVNLCRSATSAEKFQLMVTLALMSFHDDVDMVILRVLIAYATTPELKNRDPPHWLAYENFHYNQPPTISYLKQLIRPCCAPYDRGEIDSFHISFKTRKRLAAEELKHEQVIERESISIAEFLLSQWPCKEPVTQDMPPTSLVDISRVLKIVNTDWIRLYQNMELSDYLTQIQLVLSTLGGRPFEWETKNLEREIYPTRFRNDDTPTLARCLARRYNQITINFLEESSQVLAKPVNRSKYTRRSWGNTQGTLGTGQPDHTHAFHHKSVQGELAQIIEKIANSKSLVRQQYGRELAGSLQALQNAQAPIQQSQEEPDSSKLFLEMEQLFLEVRNKHQQIQSALEHGDRRAKWLKSGGIWPCITVVSVLEHLRSVNKTIFGAGMKENLVSYAMLITSAQRTRRMNNALMKRDMRRYFEEQNTLPHSNWDPSKNPDWLLLEIDADIAIRPNQIEVACATISPSSGSNSVLQMNMGQGKTSCIMPMVVALLSDSKRLVRVIVPKPLLVQTAQLLQVRLGGLVGREVRHIPFSRRTPTDSGTMQTYFNIHKAIMFSAGVVVGLPEHMLSFKLSGLQRLLDDRMAEANQLVKIQSWMNRVCRDVLDECDFTLAPRTQLIYPSGTQSAVDGHPHRWETAQRLLELVESHLETLQGFYPRSIEVIWKAKGEFPFVFFLRKDVEERLIELLVSDLIQGRTPILPTRGCTPSERIAIRTFITEASGKPKIVQQVATMFPDNVAVRQNIYLLRGLLVHRILLLVLKKRWNVQYGLHPQRDPVAVPFYAKGVPSDQAEWGHPDVAILFTCLSFYFGGLDLAQMRQCLNNLTKSNDPASEYDVWIHRSASLPGILRDWNSVNTEDESQVSEIWRHLRCQTVVVNYFLNHFVFPRHAKQFRAKLQASGWDIPLFSLQEGNRSLTTGFSGTNDNRTILPLTVEQRDLDSLSHTNSEVLTYLLQPRNRRCILAANQQGKRLSESELLQLLHDKGIRVLIDAGAQILEMDNLTLAREWLRIHYNAPAAMYFDEANKPWIIYRNGSKIPLLASPFAENLGECLVYLDEAHTRGTDLKIPEDAVGALTLGLGQTKDHTVQAAMRLRQLGTTQSVVFLAPPEVHQSILDANNKTFWEKIDSRDVIYWLLEQTCNAIEQIQPLYFSQGMDFSRRTQAALDHPNFLSNRNEQLDYCDVIRNEELQTLEQLYKPSSKPKLKSTVGSFCPQIAKIANDLQDRRKGFQDFGNAVHGSALQEVEQEREVAFEVEAVREVQKPHIYISLSFPGLDRDVLAFARTGELSTRSSSFCQAFIALKSTGIGQKHGINHVATTSKLFVSAEFLRTIRLLDGRPNDNFLRPVNWLIWSVSSETALVIIPEEAELLIPLFQEQASNRTSPVYLLTYAAPVTRDMLQFNKLDFFSLPSLPKGWKAPRWLIIQLGVLAGRIYFEYEEYDDLCEYLGISPLDDGGDGDVAMANTLPSGETPCVEDNNAVRVLDSEPRFTRKPLLFMQEWLSIRCKGQDFTHTPMGYVCQGKPLSIDSAFFCKKEPRTHIPKLGGSANDDGQGSEDLEHSDESEFGDYDERYIEDEGIGPDADLDEHKV